MVETRIAHRHDQTVEAHRKVSYEGVSLTGHLNTPLLLEPRHPAHRSFEVLVVPFDALLLHFPRAMCWVWGDRGHGTGIGWRLDGGHGLRSHSGVFDGGREEDYCCVN